MGDKNFLVEARLVDFSDSDLKEFLGGTHDRLKSLEENSKQDIELDRLRSLAKAYYDDNFGEEIKRQKAFRKAARALAAARGIQWKDFEVTK